jgi:hypothetical protein
MALETVIWSVVAIAIVIVALMLWFGRRDVIVSVESRQPTMEERMQRLDDFQRPPMNDPHAAVNDRPIARDAPPAPPPPALPSPEPSDPSGRSTRS